MLENAQAHPDTHRQNKLIKRLVTYVSGQLPIFMTSYLQPIQSRHFLADVIQLRQRVIQQYPVNQ